MSAGKVKAKPAYDPRLAAKAERVADRLGLNKTLDSTKLARAEAVADRLGLGAGSASKRRPSKAAR